MKIMQNGKYAEYADAHAFGQVIDVHKEQRSKNIEVSSTGVHIANSQMAAENGMDNALDISSWLGFAAKDLVISSNLNDYVFVPVITMASELPNRNGVGFPLDELARWNPEYGMQAYKTFKGKPAYVEHANDVLEHASGVIADAYLRKMAQFGQGKVWKLVELMAIDRSKNPELASGILKKEKNSWSMGAMVSSYTCSYCGSELGKCDHISKARPLDFYELGGNLVYRQCRGIAGFETSNVGVGAFPMAVTDVVL